VLESFDMRTGCQNGVFASTESSSPCLLVVLFEEQLLALQQDTLQAVLAPGKRPCTATAGGCAGRAGGSSWTGPRDAAAVHTEVNSNKQLDACSARVVGRKEVPLDAGTQW
jgi:hypothetical protein